MNRREYLKTKGLAAGSALVAVRGVCSDTSDKLMYTHGMHSFSPPAKNKKKWMEGFVTGNGTMGVMVTGYTDRELLFFNHEKLYLPKTKRETTPPPDIGKYVPEMQQMMLEGRYDEAYQWWWKKANEDGWDKVLDGNKIVWTDGYHQGFALEIAYPESAEPVAGYIRQTDFETGEISVGWNRGCRRFQTRTFVSRPDRVAVHMVEAATASIKLIPPLPENVVNSVDVSEDWIVFRSKYDELHTRGYIGVVRKLRQKNGMLLLSAIESVEQFDRDADKTEGLMKADLSSLKPDYDYLLARHADMHGEMFRRCLVNLKPGSDYFLDNEALLAKQKEMVADNRLSAALTQKLFEMSRFTYIGSCGGLPPNLPGVWNPYTTAAWSGDYTTDTNINLQMAGGNIGNLPETVVYSYWNLIRDQIDDWETNARSLYNCRGVMAPSRTDGRSGYMHHSSVRWYGWFWTAGAGWLAYPLYEYCEVTGDEKFLREDVLPLYEKIALFYEDFLTHRDENGNYVYVPSFSPENRAFVTKGGKEMSTLSTVNAVMDLAVCRQVLEILVRESKRLGLYRNRVGKWKQMLKDLPPYLNDEDGALKEWAHPDIRDNHAHRHAAQTYPAWPSHEMGVPEDNPALHAAMVKMLRKRKNGFDFEMKSAHGLLVRAFAAARLRETEIYKQNCLALFTNRYILPSLFTLHNPGSAFNADFINSWHGLLLEGLVYSREGVVELLPSLPDDYVKGSAYGILCRGQIKIESLKWDLDQKVLTAMLVSKKDQKIQLLCRRTPAALMVNGKDRKVKLGTFGIPLKLKKGKMCEVIINIE
ncbi:MAG: glycoside hydrolase N-terminal domain-containing protein [Kiritimatiellales bacterium]|nr:glycoside hydrolase N-terminal domain-containing protein [Kiritimatiellales bacterium]